MKKVTFLFLLLVGVVAVYFISGKEKIQQGIAVVPTTIQKEIEHTTQKASYATPIRLRIHKIGVDASVESVGMDAKGNMDVPKNDEHVAWFNLGYKMGEAGNTVLAGHLDTKTGAPAVFWDLKKLKAGDEIVVTGDNGKEYIYEVTHVQTYAANAFPLQDVFGSYAKNRVNLITCEGQYRESTGYSDRTVVFSELTN